MRITNLTFTNPTQTNLFISDIRLYALNTYGTDKDIFMKFGMEITPMKSASKLYFLIFYNY
jgi:hypothetical protein